MRWNRRDLFKFMTGAAAFASLNRPFAAAAAPEVAPHPDPSTFTSGDFLWPAKPETFIPYSRSATPPGGVEAAQWEAQRDAFLAQTPVPDDPAAREIRNRLSRMTYEEFRAVYLQDTDTLPQDGMRTRSFSLPSVAVGHVAILEIGTDGVQRVIEAVPAGKKNYQIVTDRFKNGVVVTPYSDWIAEHKDYKVWHGRVKQYANRGAIAAAARGFLNRDYWFWSLDFGDESAFYCSKLVWVSAFKGLGLALDGDANKARQLWLSPKRLMKLDTVQMLHSPGNYG
jgi:hypothetical protein